MYYNLHYKIKYKVKTSAVIFVFSIQCLIYHLPEIISLKKWMIYLSMNIFKTYIAKGKPICKRGRGMLR